MILLKLELTQVSVLGVKVGCNSSVGSDVLLYEDLDSDKVVLVKQEHIISNKKEDK